MANAYAENLMMGVANSFKTNSDHMALLKYLKKEERFPLPDPLGLLSTKVLSFAIQVANKGVK